MTPIYYLQFRCPTTGRFVRDGTVRPMSRTEFEHWRGTRQLRRVGCACRDGAHFLGTQDYALDLNVGPPTAGQRSAKTGESALSVADDF